MVNASAIPNLLNLGNYWQVFKPLLIYVVGMVIYSVFIFKFYRFVARRDVFKLDLKQYNKAQHPALVKTLGGILYFLEYILLFPLITFFSFAVFALLIAIMSDQQLSTVLVLSMAIIAAVRTTAYYNEDLSKDLAKMLPFALLGIFLLDTSFIQMSDVMDSVRQFPSLFGTMAYYFVFVVALEFVLRIGHGFFSLFKRDKVLQK